MTGKTHLASGIAASFSVVLPRTPKEVLVCLGAAMVGAVISDIDVSTSEARRNFNKLLGTVAVLLLIAGFLEYYVSFPILNMARQYGYLLTIAGFFLFLIVCIYGKGQPHRSFMHSLLALALLAGSIYMIFPPAVFPFVIAMASHILLDLLNKRRVKLFYPFRKGIALSVCRSDGTVNTILFYAAVLIDFVMAVWILFQYFF